MFNLEVTATPKRLNDARCVWQVVDPVANYGMRLDRQTLSRYPKAADAVLFAVLQCREQRFCID